MCDLGESPDVSVCHTISTVNFPLVCQLHDSSVSHSSHNSTWKSEHPSACLSSNLSIIPSAEVMVKVLSGIYGENT